MQSAFHTYFTEFEVFLQWTFSIQGKILSLSSAWSSGSEICFLVPLAGLLMSTLQHWHCADLHNFCNSEIQLMPEILR